MVLRTLLLSAGTLLCAAPVLLLAAAPGRSVIDEAALRAATERLVARHGAGEAERIRAGVARVAERWWQQDGDAAAFIEFCEAHYLATEVERARAFARLEQVLEQVDGHLLEVRRMLTTPVDLETGPLTPLDERLAELDLQAHVDADLFATKTAFLALLNFPVHTLAERLADGPGFTPEAWARSRLMDRFDRRIPAEVLQEATRAFTAADQYMSRYNVVMAQLVTASGERLFPATPKLISHWGLRDELASHYGEEAGLAKQRMIQRVMERIVRQEIPAVVPDNPDVTWCPETNEVTPPAAPAREPDTRYARLLDVFRAVRAADAFSPTARTYIDRKFEIDRQIPEARVTAILESVLASDEVRALARRIAARLKRPLEPFDIWYSGFKSRSGRSEKELDAIVSRRYPTLAAFAADLPRILRDLGFSAEKASWLAERIVVDPARGAGHALGAVRREDRAHLRTRVPAEGMNYKGYNIAIHELGHNVEQTFSLHEAPSWALAGVPNNAITEAFAFVFQNRDLELLGLGAKDSDARRNEALGTLWATYEIGGVSLVDMRVWRWMYEHPDATPQTLREATLAIAREVWNRYYAPVLGVRDSEILAIYSHMIVYGLYLPDYPLGHVVAFQIARKLSEGDFGREFERMARQGRLTPDLWMRRAVGAPLSAEALLAEARAALATADATRP